MLEASLELAFPLPALPSDAKEVPGANPNVYLLGDRLVLWNGRGAQEFPVDDIDTITAHVLRHDRSIVTARDRQISVFLDAADAQPLRSWLADARDADTPGWSGSWA